MLKLLVVIVSCFGTLCFTSGVEAHSGRTNSEGCHNDRIHGGYHCHNGGYSEPAYQKALVDPQVVIDLAARQAHYAQQKADHMEKYYPNRREFASVGKVATKGPVAYEREERKEPNTIANILGAMFMIAISVVAIVWFVGFLLHPKKK